MKKIAVSLLFILFGIGNILHAQDVSNFISCNVDGKEWKAEAKRMKIPVSGFEYLAIAGFKVSPDVQVWIRLYYFTDSLKTGTYQIISEDDVNSQSRKKADRNLVWALVDYTEETKGLGHAFHDGESMSGTLTITKTSKTSIEGSFEASLKVQNYQKRALATMSGSGIRSNIERKIMTNAGGGMLANGGPHDHDNTKKTDDKGTIVLSGGKFHMDWSKPDTKSK